MDRTADAVQTVDQDLVNQAVFRVVKQPLERGPVDGFAGKALVRVHPAGLQLACSERAAAELRLLLDRYTVRAFHGLSGIDGDRTAFSFLCVLRGGDDRYAGFAGSGRAKPCRIRQSCALNSPCVTGGSQGSMLTVVVMGEASFREMAGNHGRKTRTRAGCAPCFYRMPEWGWREPDAAVFAAAPEK